MSRRKAEEALKQARPGKTNALWFAGRGLLMLTRQVDPKLALPAMQMLAKRGALLSHLRKLPAEFEPLAREQLALAQSVEATFFAAWKGDVRSAGKWVYELQKVPGWGGSPKRTVSDKQSAPRLAQLVTDAAVEATQAAIAAHGLAVPRLLCVLAYDGSESSADIVLPLAKQALEERDAALDALKTWVIPFARGPHFTKLVEALQRATGEREATTSPLRAWLQGLGVEGSSAHFELVFHSRDEKWSLWLKLDSKQLPHVLLALSSNRDEYYCVEDFKVRHAKKASFAPPTSLEDVPAWVVRVSKQQRIKWNAEPRWVKSSLRGKARTRAIAWLMSRS